MAIRPIDGDELLGITRLLDTDAVRQSKTASWLLDQVLHDIQAMPTLTPPNEPLTLDQLRERWERCEHCRGNNELRYPSAHELVIDGRDIYYHDTDDGWEGVEINFCPWCGRPLTDEAWAKLERRLQGMPLPKPPEEG